ncbi:putative minor capsid protein [Jeotgalibaca porci]|uniref:putative minor capsid protein n=1 Tax=Jeotgalibaca porci TaxID=1868793 RepID=UPI0035A11D8C
MVSFSPIPTYMLIHDVIYHPPIEEDDGGMGGGETPEPIPIKQVRFEPKRKKITKIDNSESYTNGILFIDYVNSKPFTMVHENGVIEFNGRKLSIVEVKELYTIDPAPHHLEVMLQ